MLNCITTDLTTVVKSNPKKRVSVDLYRTDDVRGSDGTPCTLFLFLDVSSFTSVPVLSWTPMSQIF